MRVSTGSMIVLLTLAITLPRPVSGMPQDGDKVTFDDHVRPIFQQRCAGCHNADRRSAGLDLTNFTNMMQGGGSGQAVEPGEAGESYLFQLVTHEESPEMPPGGTRIPDSEIRTIETWINAGALENSGSVANIRRKNIPTATNTIGVRPELVARPPRMSLQPSFVTPRPGLVRSIAISPWTHLAALSAAKQVLLYDTKSRDLLGMLPFPEGQANVIRFSRNGQLLLAGGGRHGLSGQVVVWDVATAQRVMEAGSEVDNVLAADISADHSRIALGGPQKMLRVYDTSTGELLYEVKKHTDWITALEFSPDGVLLASADRNGGLHLWESETGNEYLTLRGHDGSIRAMSWRSDANLLATAGDDGQIRLWEVENGGQIRSWKADSLHVTDVRFRRNGQLVTCGRDNQVKLWQQDGKLVRQFTGLNEMGVTVAACDESDVVLAANLTGAVVVWNAADGEQLDELESNPPELSVRLQQASANLFELQAAAQPLETGLAALNKRLTEISEDIRSNQESRDRFAADLTEFRLRSEATAKQLEDLEQQRSEWKQELSDTQAALPLMADAINQAKIASQRLPGDGELKSLVDALAASHDRHTQRAQALSRQIEESTRSETDRKTDLDQLRGQIDETQSNWSRAEEVLSQFREQLAPLQAEQKKLAAELEIIRGRMNEAEAAVAGWKAEIEFDRQLKQLLQAWAEARQQVEQQEAVVESASNRLREAEAEYQQRLEEKSRSEAKAAEVQNQIRQLRSLK